MDTLQITILDDGTIKIDSGTISAANHMTAEAFLRNIATVGGATQERKHKHGILGAAVHALHHRFGMGHKH